MKKIVFFIACILCLNTFSHSQNIIKYIGLKVTLKKNGIKWSYIDHKYRYFGQYIDAYSDYVEIKSDEQFFYIGQSQAYLDSLENSLKKSIKESPIEEGFIFEEELPETEFSTQYQFFGNTNDSEKSKQNLIRKQFVGYQNILRIPKKGGWVQKIGFKKFHQDSEGYSVDPNQDEWWNDFQVKLSLMK
jgi:hypothetical protein